MTPSRIAVSAWLSLAFTASTSSITMVSPLLLAKAGSSPSFCPASPR